MMLLLRVVSVLTVLVMSALGQGLTGSISGSITDASGSAIPGAAVTLTNINTSQTREAVTQSNGDFVFTQLLPGTFQPGRHDAFG